MKKFLLLRFFVPANHIITMRWILSISMHNTAIKADFQTTSRMKWEAMQNRLTQNSSPTGKDTEGLQAMYHDDLTSDNHGFFLVVLATFQESHASLCD
jgi:hypothetical protein